MMPLLQHYTGFWNFCIPNDLQQATGEMVSADKIHTFLETVWMPFVGPPPPPPPPLMENISSLFATHDIVSALAIFDPGNVPSTDSSQFSAYGEKSIEVLLYHYRKDKFALALIDEETGKTAVISPEVHTEWLTFHTLLVRNPKTA